MPRPTNETGITGWVLRWWRPLLAEIVSTAILVGMGCATLVEVGGPKSVQLTHVALAFGGLVVANVAAFGSMSGAHMNPAVTLAAALCGQLQPLVAVAYAIAQCVGATLGASSLLGVTPASLLTQPVCITLPAPALSLVGAVCIEAAITAVLVWSACGLWAAHEPQRPDRTVGLQLGLVITALVYVAGPYTGASINPARSLGPALAQGVWKDQWVYWVGPLFGASLAALLHRWVLTPLHPALRRSHSAENQDPAQLPLNDKP